MPLVLRDSSAASLGVWESWRNRAAAIEDQEQSGLLKSALLVFI